MKNGVWNFFVQATLIHPLEEIEYTQFVHHFCDTTETLTLILRINSK